MRQLISDLRVRRQRAAKADADRIADIDRPLLRIAVGVRATEGPVPDDGKRPERLGCRGRVAEKLFLPESVPPPDQLLPVIPHPEFAKQNFAQSSLRTLP